MRIHGSTKCSRDVLLPVLPFLLLLGLSSVKGLPSVLTSHASRSVTWVKSTMETTVSVEAPSRRLSIAFPFEEKQSQGPTVGISHKDKSCSVSRAEAPPESERCLHVSSDGDTWLGVLHLKWQVTQRDRGRAADGCDSKFCYVPTDASKTLKSCAHISYSHSAAREEILMSV